MLRELLRECGAWMVWVVMAGVYLILKVSFWIFDKAGLIEVRSKSCHGMKKI